MASAFKAETPNKNSYGNWKNIGPFGDPEVHWSATGNGAIQYLEMDPKNPAIMYACSRNGGLWKTVNYGQNWTPETDYFATNNTSCIEVCPQDPSILYLGRPKIKKYGIRQIAAIHGKTEVQELVVVFMTFIQILRMQLAPLWPQPVASS
jgi:hypothetical protein